MIGALLVFLMQAGYAMVEVGSVATRNPQKIILKNLLEAAFSAVLFGAVGYGLAFGNTNDEGILYGVIGKDFFLFKKDDYSDGTGYIYASWLLQWAFVALTCTIACASMTERITLKASLIYVFFLVCIIYPPIACIIWNTQGIGSARKDQDRLFGCGVLDFAGAGVIHMTGGISALIGAIILGPRRAFLMNEVDVCEYGKMFQTMGTLVLWFGWFGLHGASSMHLVNYGEVVSKTLIMTTISATIGGFGSVLMSTYLRGKSEVDGLYHLKPETFHKGVLAGLVSISSGCSVMEPYGAAITGLLGSFLCVFVSNLLNEWGIDDVLQVFPVHGVGGALGLILTGVFATPHNYGQVYETGRADKCAGVLFGGSGSQLAANGVAFVVILLWVSLTSAAVFLSLKACGILRVSEQVEDGSMDISDHAAVITNSPPASIHDLVIPESSKPLPEKEKPKPPPVRKSTTDGGRGGGGEGRGGGGKGGGGRGKVPSANGVRRTSKNIKSNVEMTSSI